MFGAGALTLRSAQRLGAERNRLRRHRHSLPLPVVDREVAVVVPVRVAEQVGATDADGRDVDARADDVELDVAAAREAEVDVLAAVDGHTRLGQARAALLPAADLRRQVVVRDEVGHLDLALVELAPDRSLGVDVRFRGVDVAQLEDAVTCSRGDAGGRQSPRGEDQSAEQDERGLPHWHDQSFLPNYALNERLVRTFLSYAGAPPADPDRRSAAR